MNDPLQTSHKLIMRNFIRIGSGSAVQGLSGLARAKLVAVMLGPAGIGIYGIFLSIIQTAVILGCVGQDLAGPRRIAQSQDTNDELELSRTIWASMVILTVFALITAAGLLIFRKEIATLIGMKEASTEIAWLSLSVVFGLLAVIPTAILQGLRRIESMARAQIRAGVASLLFGAAAIVLIGRYGIVITLILPPACLFLAGVFEARKVLRGKDLLLPSGIGAAIYDLVLKGAPFMLAGALVVGSGLAARSVIQHSLGTTSLGMYAAATTLSMTYLPLLLGALGADYLPRMSAIVNRPTDAAALLSDQTEVALLIFVPIALGMISIAPWLMVLLFRADFRDAALLLQLLVLADILRVFVWPLGFVLLARGEGMVQVGVELCVQGFFLAFTVFAVSSSGLTVTGLAFPISALLSVGLMYVLIGRRLPFRPQRKLMVPLICGLLLAGCAIYLSLQNEAWGAMFGFLAALLYGRFSLVRLARLTGAKGILGFLTTIGVSS